MEQVAQAIIAPVLGAIAVGAPIMTRSYFSSLGLAGAYLMVLLVFFVLCLIVGLTFPKNASPRSGKNAKSRSRNTSSALPSTTKTWLPLLASWVVALLILLAFPFIYSNYPGRPYRTHPNDIRMPIASAFDLKDSVVEKKTVFPNRIPMTLTRLQGVAEPTYLISDKTFIDCDFFGPDTILMDGPRTAFQDSFIARPPNPLISIESYILSSAAPLTIGPLPFVNCGFIRCRFAGISFTGSPATLEKFRKTMPLKVN